MATWNKEEGGVEKLSDEQLKAAQEAYKEWSEERESAGEKTFGFDKYVDYVQGKNKDSKSENKEVKEEPKIGADLKNYGEKEDDNKEASDDFNKTLFGDTQVAVSNIFEKISSDMSANKDDIKVHEMRGVESQITGRAMQEVAREEQANPINATRQEAVLMEIHGKVEERSGSLMMKEADFLRNGSSNPAQEMKMAALDKTIDNNTFKDFKDKTGMMENRFNQFVEKGFAEKKEDGSFKLTDEKGLKEYLGSNASNIDRQNAAYQGIKSEHSYVSVQTKSFSKAIENKDLSFSKFASDFKNSVQNFEKASRWENSPGANVLNFALSAATAVGITSATASMKLANYAAKNFIKIAADYKIDKEREKLGVDNDKVKEFEGKEALRKEDAPKDVYATKTLADFQKEIDTLKAESGSGAVAKASSEAIKEKVESDLKTHEERANAAAEKEPSKEEVKETKDEGKFDKQSLDDKLAAYRVEKTNDNSDKASNNPEPTYEKEPTKDGSVEAFKEKIDEMYKESDTKLAQKEEEIKADANKSDNKDQNSEEKLDKNSLDSDKKEQKEDEKEEVKETKSEQKEEKESEQVEEKAEEQGKEKEEEDERER